MATVYSTTFQLRRGLASVWVKNNPVLANGEPGFEKDTFRLKIGDGVKNWLDLPYIGESDYSIAPDGNSLVLNQNNEMMLYGFEDAEIGQIPVKSENGKLIWVTIDPASLTGKIEDLKQEKTIVLFGGSASEVFIDG